MKPFDPASSLAGGLLIGLAAGLLLLLGGRVAGVSGILGAVVRRDAPDLGWRAAFLLGLPLGAAVVGALRGGLQVDVASSPATLVAAGLLVGFGTQLGSGCTSGHGVCGISRGSPRSLAATLTFMGVAALVVFAMRHAIGSGA